MKSQRAWKFSFQGVIALSLTLTLLMHLSLHFHSRALPRLAAAGNGGGEGRAGESTDETRMMNAVAEMRKNGKSMADLHHLTVAEFIVSGPLLFSQRLSLPANQSSSG